MVCVCVFCLFFCLSLVVFFQSPTKIVKEAFFLPFDRFRMACKYDRPSDSYVGVHVSVVVADRWKDGTVTRLLQETPRRGGGSCTVVVLGLGSGHHRVPGGQL